MRIELPGGTPADYAPPGDGAPTQGLVLCPDIMGLRPLFATLAERLADENGWVVVAPEPFAGHESMPLEERMGWVGNFDDAAVLAMLVEAADATGQERVGIVGFCLGGMWALKGSSSGRFHRAVSFYGMIRMPDQWRSPTQHDALDLLTRPGAYPVLQLTGSEDHWVPATDIADLRAAGSEAVVYPGADHGFVHDATRPTHRPDDAADAWARAIGFLNL